MIEMELDHDTGNMDGRRVAGSLAGRRLGSLDEALLRRLYQECRVSDPDGARLLEAYFDRRFPAGVKTLSETNTLGRSMTRHRGR